jgi:alpha-L-arabinofuranosidase
MFKTVSYYVQQLYATNAGTNVLSLTMDKKPVANQPGQNGLFASAAFDSKTGEVIIKVANTSKQPQAIQLNLSDVKGDRTAQTWTLCHDGMDDENSIQRPELITPQKGTAQVVAGKKQATVSDQLPAMSFRIYRIKK